MARRSAIGVFNGNWKSRWRVLREEEDDRRIFIIEKNKEKFGQALDVLISNDPHGWERWYDDDNNVPNYLKWTDTREIDSVIFRILQHADSLRRKKP